MKPRRSGYRLRNSDTPRGREVLRQRVLRLIEKIEDGQLEVSRGIAERLRTQALQSVEQSVQRTELDVLAELLEDSDDHVREEAARCIREQSHQVNYLWTTQFSCAVWRDPQTVPRLQAGLQDKNPAVRRHLLAVHVQLASLLLPRSGYGAGLLPVLLDCLRDHIDDVRLEAVRAIRKLGVDLASEAVELLAELLAAAEPPDIRLEACAALKWLGPDAVAAVPTLVEQIASEPASSGLRRRMAAALVAIDPDGDVLAGVNEPSQQQSLLRGLRELGPSGRALRRVLPSCWRDAADQIPLMSTTEIASRLDVSERTVRRRLQRIEPELRQECRGKRVLYRIDDQTLERLRKL